MKYLDDEGLRYKRSAYTTGAAKAGLPHRPTVFPWSSRDVARELDGVEVNEYSDDSVVSVLNGRALMLHCWRQNHGTNPIHFMFGYGALLSVLANVAGRMETADHVIFHQCPTPRQGQDFHKVLWEVTLNLALKRGLFSTETRYYTTTAARLLCMENVRDNHTYLNRINTYLNLKILEQEYMN